MTDLNALEALCERLRAWGENSPDPDFFSGDVLGMVLDECRLAGDGIAALVAEVRGLRAGLEWIAQMAEVRAADEKQVFTRVNRGALRNIATRARSALHPRETT